MCIRDSRRRTQFRVHTKAWVLDYQFLKKSLKRWAGLSVLNPSLAGVPFFIFPSLWRRISLKQESLVRQSIEPVIPPVMKGEKSHYILVLIRSEIACTNSL